MNLTVNINNQPLILEYTANETLLRALRRHGYFGVKHGWEKGELCLYDKKGISRC